MKKVAVYLFLPLFVFQSRVFSQTLTSTSNPVIPDTYKYQDCPYMASGPAGIGQYWDFSTAVKNQISNVGVYFNHAMGLDCFPSNMIVSKTVQGALANSFAIQTSNMDMFCKGARYSQAPPICFSNEETLLTYPFSYGSTFSDTWVGVTMPLFSPQINISGTSTVLADGTGTLVTPAGTYTNVLRIKSDRIYQIVTNATLVENYQEESYYWYQPGVHGEIMRITEITSPALTPTQTLAYRDDGPVGLIEGILNTEGFSMYPNPAKDKLFVSTEKGFSMGSELLIYNAVGQVILKQKTRDEKIISMDLSSIKPGVYYLSLGSEQKLNQLRKLVIVR